MGDHRESGKGERAEMKRAIVMGAVTLTSIWAAVPAPVQAGTGKRSYVVMVKDGLDPAQVATAQSVLDIRG